MFFAQAVLPNINGLARSSVVNTFTIGGGDPEDPAQVLNAIDAVADFYSESNPTSLTSLGEYLSSELSRVANACEVKLYNLPVSSLDGQTPLGSPIDVGHFTLDANGSSAPMASEVAICVTLEGTGRSTAAVESPDGSDSDAKVDRPKQRHTGRHYIGPLCATAGTAVSSVLRPSAGIKTHLAEAYQRLYDQLQTGGMTLGVWSRKNAAYYPLEAISIDDAFDTMRSRGAESTARTRTAIS